MTDAAPRVDGRRHRVGTPCLEFPEAQDASCADPVPNPARTRISADQHSEGGSRGQLGPSRTSRVAHREKAVSYPKLRQGR